MYISGKRKGFNFLQKSMLLIISLSRSESINNYTMKLDHNEKEMIITTMNKKEKSR